MHGPWGLETPSLQRVRCLIMSQVNLCRWQTPTDYQTARENVFPSRASLQWFLRSHRRQLIAAGALASVNRRVLIDPPRFDGVVLQIGRQTAGRSFSGMEHASGRTDP